MNVGNAGRSIEQKLRRIRDLVAEISEDVAVWHDTTDVEVRVFRDIDRCCDDIHARATDGLHALQRFLGTSPRLHALKELKIRGYND